MSVIFTPPMVRLTERTPGIPEERRADSTARSVFFIFLSFFDGARMVFYEDILGLFCAAGGKISGNTAVR